MNKKFNYLLVLLFSLFVYSNQLFCESATKTECMEKVEEVSLIIEEKGIRKAAEAVMAKKSNFVWKDSYVFIIHTKGMCVAHPGKPKLVGKNVLSLRDDDGKYFIKALIKSAKEKGACWTDYKFPRPNSRQETFKLTYVKQTGSFIVGAGMYIE